MIVDAGSDSLKGVIDLGSRLDYDTGGAGCETEDTRDDSEYPSGPPGCVCDCASAGSTGLVA